MDPKPHPNLRLSFQHAYCLIVGRYSANMLLEDQRFLHEDLERLEQAISDRIAEDPRHVSSERKVLEGLLIER